MKIYDTLTKKMRPTQICVGFMEVQDKKTKLGKLNKNQLVKYLKENPLPAIAGPDGRMYLTDHHHLGRALLELGIERSFFVVQHDFSDIPEKKFFDVLKVLDLVHPFDEKGQQRDYSEIPKKLTELRDDPYRALAGFVRRAGGYRKVDVPYLEFKWADYFRPLIAPEQLMTRKGMKKAVAQCIPLAQAPEASHMLGWVGPILKFENLQAIDNTNNLQAKTTPVVNTPVAQDTNPAINNTSNVIKNIKDISKKLSSPKSNDFKIGKKV